MRRVRGREISMIFQEPMTSLNPVFKIGRQVIEMILTHKPETSAADARAHAIRMLSEVGIPEPETRIDQYPHELSGGMRQRVNIIRALAYNPKVILLDEPFGPLDAQTRLQLQDLLLKLWVDREGTTLVFITHDLAEAVALGDRVVVMTARPGRVREIVNVDLPRPRDIYTIHTDPHFRRIYDRIWQHLADEMRVAS
jgi:ABC-type dipeptide/oligopeptide/nickel transport system ATPase component